MPECQQHRSFQDRLTQHQDDEISSIAQLGDSVFELQPRVHLQEKVFPRIVVDEELDGSSRLIVQSCCVFGGAVCQGLAETGMALDKRARALFDDLQQQSWSESSTATEAKE